MPSSGADCKRKSALQAQFDAFRRHPQYRLDVRKPGGGEIVEVSQAMLEVLATRGVLDREPHLLQRGSAMIVGLCSAELWKVSNETAAAGECASYQFHGHEYFIGYRVFTAQTVRVCGSESEPRVVLRKTDHHDRANARPHALLQPVSQQP